MKLYTEEQVKQIQQAILCNHKDAITDANYCLNVATPIGLLDSVCINCDEPKSTHNLCMDCIIKIGRQNIQLPTNEEIEKKAFDQFCDGQFIDGAKWMRDKIQGGEQ
jgi:hypothetical protein